MFIFIFILFYICAYLLAKYLQTWANSGVGETRVRKLLHT